MKTLIVIIALGLFPLVMQAQPQRARERVQTLKKVKLMEVLNLNETDADKFLAKYSGYENRVMDKRQALQNAMRDLNQSVKGDKSGLRQKADLVLKLQEEMHSLMLEKDKAMRSSLNDEQFAKYLLFERNFARELKMRMDEMGPGPDDGPGPRGKGMRRGQRDGD